MEGEKTYTYTTNHPLILESTRPEKEVDATLRAVGESLDAHKTRGGFFWGGGNDFWVDERQRPFLSCCHFLCCHFELIICFQISNKDDKTR